MYWAGVPGGEEGGGGRTEGGTQGHQGGQAPEDRLVSYLPT